MGDGPQEISERFKNLGFNRDNIFVYTGFNEELAHQLYAAGDFLLMPSRFEPCGLAQLIAMKYGTIPIVNSTGGLKDTVIDIKNGGYGFSIDEVSANILYYSIKKAIDLYKHKKQLEMIAKKCMASNFSWTKSAGEYITLYKDLLYQS